MNDKEAIENLCDLIGRGEATIVCCDDDGDIYDVNSANDPWNGSVNRIRNLRKENDIRRFPTISTEELAPRYIDANAAIKSFKNLHIEGNCYTPAFIVEFLGKQPTADVQEVKHGKWIGKPLAGYSYCKCSNCHRVTEVFVSTCGIASQKYCPNCGVKLDLEEAND